MSYSAFIACNCYRDGLCIEPPHKEHVIINEEGPHLDISKEIRLSDHGFEMDAAFQKWKNTACEHPDMELLDISLTTNSGMDDFKSAVNFANEESSYNTLLKHLPFGHGGFVPIKDIQIFLVQLNMFQKAKAEIGFIRLVEKDTGRLIASCPNNEERTFMFAEHNKYHFGINVNGFFIRENTIQGKNSNSRMIFTGNLFSQKRNEFGGYLFENINGALGGSCNCSMSLLQEEQGIAEETVFKIERYYTAAGTEYYYLIQDLKKLAEVSIASGNPVCWT